MHIRKIALALLLGAAACDESPVSLPEPAGVTVPAAAMALAVGDQSPVAAQVVDQDGRVMQDAAVVYSTDNASVATVGTEGMVRAVAPGTANVTATSGASTAVVKVTVTAQALRVAVASDSIGLVVGEAAPMVAQVLNAGGQVQQGAAVVFRTSNPFVATVDTEGTVRATGPGTATVSVLAPGATTAAVKVTVAPDPRSELRSLEVMADSLLADRRAGVQIVSVRAFNGLGQAVCPALTLQSSDRTVAVARPAGACRIEIEPLFVGETTITAASGGHTDTFLVRVTNSGQIAFFSARPSSEQLVAGATVSYTVRMLDQTSQPIANRRVNVDVSVGALSASTVTTGEDGTATVQWHIPTDLRNWGQNHSITLRALLPNGTVASQTENVFIDGASLADIRLYRRDNTGGFTQLATSSIGAQGYTFTDVGAGGVDQYGNVRAADFTFALSGPYGGWGCGADAGTRHSSGVEYTCFYGYPGTSVTLTATAVGGGGSRSVQVNFTN
jgi:hypothetical protein